MKIYDIFPWSKKTSIEPQNVAQASRENDLFIKIIRRQVSLYRKDIDKWRTAHSEALNIRRPSRVLLYELYDDIMLDAHLSAVIESRMLRIANADFEIVDENSKKDDELTAMIQKRWAIQYNRLALQSKFYGYSLIKLELGVPVNPTQKNKGLQVLDVKLFPREHVVPELGAVRLDVNGNDTISYSEPPESNYYIGIGQTDDFGLLLKAAPLCIFKKNAIAHWSKFQEIYGIPPRIAKTASRDKKVQDEIVNWLEEMGSSAYGLFPEGTEFEFLNPNSTDAFKVFDQGIERINAELSKLILGQTMTTDNGSSRSQSEVHERKEDEIVEADMSFIEYEWNDKLIPILIQHGYPLDGKRFVFDRSQRLEAPDQWKIVNEMLSQGYNIPDDYIRETFYVPVEGREKPTNPINPGNTDPQKAKNKNTKDPENHFMTLRDELDQLYGHTH